MLSAKTNEQKSEWLAPNAEAQEHTSKTKQPLDDNSIPDSSAKINKNNLENTSATDAQYAKVAAGKPIPSAIDTAAPKRSPAN